MNFFVFLDTSKHTYIFNLDKVGFVKYDPPSPNFLINGVPCDGRAQIDYRAGRMGSSLVFTGRDANKFIDEFTAAIKRITL